VTVRTRSRGVRAAALLIGLAACAGPLRYRPEWPPDVEMAADYRVAGDQLRVELDTGGYRVEAAHVLLADGRAVPARRLLPPEARGGSGLTIGLGVGGSGSIGSVGVGGGVGLPVWGGRPRAHSLAEFALAEIGPAPWRLQVKAVGLGPVVIVLGRSPD
jgi:hypothetical protein